MSGNNSENKQAHLIRYRNG